MLPNFAAGVLSTLRDDLNRKGIAPGDRLPSERDLSRQLGCSRETLRRVLAEMERTGDVWRHVGQGTFYGARPLGHSIQEGILVKSATPLQLMQARRTVEPSIVAEAARLATSRDIAYLTDLVRRGERATSRADCEQLDAAFHRGIAEVTGNPILLGLLDSLASARRHAAWQRQWEITYRRLGVMEFTSRHSAQHQAIVDGIAQHDPEVASAAMVVHLDTIFVAMQLAEWPVGSTPT